MIENLLKLGGRFLSLLGAEVGKPANVARPSMRFQAKFVGRGDTEELDGLCRVASAEFDLGPDRWYPDVVDIVIGGIIL